MNEQKIIEVNNLVRAKSRTELITMCKEKNLQSGGTKHDMAVRLIGGWEKTPDAQVRLSAFFHKIRIEKNENGQYVYDSLVFDATTKNVVGVLRNGAVEPLTRQDIEVCKKYKFRFMTPEKLDDNPNYTPSRTTDSSDDDTHDHDVDDDDDDNGHDDENDPPSF